MEVPVETRIRLGKGLGSLVSKGSGNQVKQEQLSDLSIMVLAIEVRKWKNQTMSVTYINSLVISLKCGKMSDVRSLRGKYAFKDLQKEKDEMRRDWEDPQKSP